MKSRLFLLGVVLVYFLAVLGFLNGSLNDAAQSQEEMVHNVKASLALTQEFVAKTQGLQRLLTSLQEVQEKSEGLTRALQKTNQGFGEALTLQEVSLNHLKVLDQEIVKLNQNLRQLSKAFSDIGSNMSGTVGLTKEARQAEEGLLSSLRKANGHLQEIDRVLP